MALLCVRGVRKIFSTSDFADRSQKIFCGRVWHHHELEISFGQLEHTGISLLYSTIMITPFHLTSFLKYNYCTISYLINLQKLNNNYFHWENKVYVMLTHRNS